MGREIYQNWINKESKGRQWKGRRPRNFDFFSADPQCPLQTKPSVWDVLGRRANLQIHTLIEEDPIKQLIGLRL